MNLDVYVLVYAARYWTGKSPKLLPLLRSSVLTTSSVVTTWSICQHFLTGISLLTVPVDACIGWQDHTSHLPLLFLSFICQSSSFHIAPVQLLLNTKCNSLHPFPSFPSRKHYKEHSYSHDRISLLLSRIITPLLLCSSDLHIFVKCLSGSSSVCSSFHVRWTLPSEFPHAEALSILTQYNSPWKQSCLGVYFGRTSASQNRWHRPSIQLFPPCP